jgi:hypothetical protein
MIEGSSELERFLAYSGAGSTTFTLGTDTLDATEL